MEEERRKGEAREVRLVDQIDSLRSELQHQEADSGGGYSEAALKSELNDLHSQLAGREQIINQQSRRY